MRGAGADSWDYTAPEWIVATQEENTLSVNAKDNTEASRVGRIEFIAGNAEASLNSRNFQQTKSSGGIPPELFALQGRCYSRTVSTPLPVLFMLNCWAFVQ